jgi:hypothetical protein
VDWVWTCIPKHDHWGAFELSMVNQQYKGRGLLW